MMSSLHDPSLAARRKECLARIQELVSSINAPVEKARGGKAAPAQSLTTGVYDAEPGLPGGGEVGN